MFWKKPLFWVILLNFILIGFLVVLGWRYYTIQKDLDRSAKVNTSSLQSPGEPADEVKKLVAEVGKHIILPEDEQPTAATVSNVEQLRNQPFFAQAQNGDKVLVYKLSRRAFLYRPSAGKVVEVAPVIIEPTPMATQSARLLDGAGESSPAARRAPLPSPAATATEMAPTPAPEF